MLGGWHWIPWVGSGVAWAFLEVELLWFEPQVAAQRVLGYSVNKACLGRSSLVAGEALWSSSDRHGGRGEKKQVELRDSISNYYGVGMLQEEGEHSRWPLFWQPTMVTIWWSLLKRATMAPCFFNLHAGVRL